MKYYDGCFGEYRRLQESEYQRELDERDREEPTMDWGNVADDWYDEQILNDQSD